MSAGTIHSMNQTKAQPLNSSFKHSEYKQISYYTWLCMASS